MTPKEANHPFNGVLALESERHFPTSGWKARIDAFIDLDIGSLGFSDFRSFVGLPRDMVEYIIEKATKIKTDKTRVAEQTAARLAAEIEGQKPKG